MKKTDIIKKMVAPCPLCGGKPLEAKEQYFITDQSPYIDGFMLNLRFKVKCEECFVGVDVSFVNGYPTFKEAEEAMAEEFKDLEDHWARKHYKGEADDS